MASNPSKSYRARLLQLAEEFDKQAAAAAAPFKQKADALRFAAHALNGHLQETKQEAGVDSMLAQAMAIREAERPRHGRPPGKGRAPLVTEADLPDNVQLARQTIVRRIMEPGKGYRLSDLVNAFKAEGMYGSPDILKHTIRELGGRLSGATSGARWTLPKPGTKQPPAKPKAPTTTAGRRPRRERTLKALNYLAQHGPLSASKTHKLLPSMGILLRYGYLRKDGDTYVRTSKPFEVETEGRL